MGQETPIKNKIGPYPKNHPCFTFYRINFTIDFVKLKKYILGTTLEKPEYFVKWCKHVITCVKICSQRTI